MCACVCVCVCVCGGGGGGGGGVVYISLLFQKRFVRFWPEMDYSIILSVAEEQEMRNYLCTDFPGTVACKIKRGWGSC